MENKQQPFTLDDLKHIPVDDITHNIYTAMLGAVLREDTEKAQEYLDTINKHLGLI